MDNRIGIMFSNCGRLAPADAIRAALLEWNRATHTNGFEPLEARFNPGECPEEPLLGGLIVLSDEQVSTGHVRLTTTDLGIDDEWSATMTSIRDEVEAGAA